MGTLQRLLADQRRILARGWKRKLDHGYCGGAVENMDRGTFRIVGRVPIKLRAIYLLSFLYAEKLRVARQSQSEEREIEFYALEQSAEFLWGKKYGEYCRKMKFDGKYIESKDKRFLSRGYLAIMHNWLIVVIRPPAKRG